jgi:arylsulfatase A-like enzyme
MAVTTLGPRVSGRHAWRLPPRAHLSYHARRGGTLGAPSDESTDRARLFVDHLALCVASGGAAGAVLAGLDLFVRGPKSAGYLAQVLGLGFGAGARLGVLFVLASALVALLRVGWLRSVLWFGGALAWTGFAVHELGLLPRFSGPYARLAFLALAAVALLSLSGALVGLSLSPHWPGTGEPRAGWLLRLPRGRRRLCALALGLATLAVLLLDGVLFVDQYPYIHEVLRRTAGFLALAALLVLGLCAGRVRYVLPTGALLLLLALVTLHERTIVSALRSAPLVELAARDLSAFSDFDVDGYPSWLGGGDCAPFDAALNPGARELPANGLDDNCRLGDLPAPVVRAPVRAQAAAANLSIVLITVDALRADHLGSYGYARPTSPNIDGWFRTGLRFTDVLAPGAYTTITMPALMRGVYPRVLSWSVARQTNSFRLVAAAANPTLRGKETWLNSHLVSLDRAHAPLALVLARLGYDTWAVVDDGGSAFLSQPLMGQGFAEYVYVPLRGKKLWDPAGDAHVVREALARLAAPQAKPFFVWLHLYGVHAPDDVHPGAPRFGDEVMDRYDHEVAHVDRTLRPLLERLSELERERPLLTMLTSDHGERFTATLRGHGTTLVEGELRVPLLVRGPGIPSGTIAQVASSVDIAPTLLARVGVRELSGFDGVDLLDAQARARRKTVLADVWRYDALGVLEAERVAALDAQHRLVFEPRTNSTRLFTRGYRSKLLLGQDAALEQAIFRYLEHTGPQPQHLLP